MKKFWLLLLILHACTSEKKSVLYDFTTTFETSKGMETATYDETMVFYTQLAETYPEINIQRIGTTDAGRPLHLVTLNADAHFNFAEIRKTKRLLLIMNGIHPGEPDGIDATMLLFRDLVQGKIDMPKSTVLVTIPIYNVGGSLNRNSTSRTNQNGPETYGFRGNARNYDLNRDFIKCDTRNARTFVEIFQRVQPDVFIDNHVSNGADYQYTLTHLFTQHNKLGGNLGNYVHDELMPNLVESLSEKSLDITPYVNVFNTVPEKGFAQFMDSPRYSTGYASLWNSLGLMVETHMLKPYKQRVEGTYELMKSMVEIIETEGDKISDLRKEAFVTYRKLSSYPIQWQIDSTQNSTLQFKGFEGELIHSELTGAKRLKYDRSKPFEKPVVYADYFKPSLEVQIPKAYVIPQGWWQVIDLLKLNQVSMTQIQSDTTFSVSAYRIKDYETRTVAYEGHYPHYNVKVETNTQEQHFLEGD